MPPRGAALPGVAAELRQLWRLGQPLVVRSGEWCRCWLARRQFGIDVLWSHEETGNGWTYQRDKRGAWAREHGIVWTEIPVWGAPDAAAMVAKRWGPDGEPIASRPRCSHSRALIPVDSRAPCSDLPSDACPQRRPVVVRSTERAATLQHRAPRYQRAMSSPNTAFTGVRACRRTTWGCLSMREVADQPKMQRPWRQQL